MTTKPEYLHHKASLTDAARKMRELDCGFLPIGSDEDDRLHGVVTDRDLVVRGLAEGEKCDTMTVDRIMTDKVLYCYEDDAIDRTASSMRDNGVYRLVVLNNPDDKRLRGVISLGDIHRHGAPQIAARAATGIARSQQMPSAEA